MKTCAHLKLLLLKYHNTESCTKHIYKRYRDGILLSQWQIMSTVSVCIIIISEIHLNTGLDGARQSEL